MTQNVIYKTRPASPVTPTFPRNPANTPAQNVATMAAHQEAENALTMALHYLRSSASNIPGATRKAVQALGALNRLNAPVHTSAPAGAGAGGFAALEGEAMTTTTHQPTDHAAQLPVSHSANRDQATASNVMMALWNRASPTLSKDDLVWLTESGEEISTSLNGLSALLTSVACLSGELEGGDFPTLDALKMSNVLFPVVDQLQVLSSMAFIANEAAYKLNHPELYREGGPLHSL